MPIESIEALSVRWVNDGVVFETCTLDLVILEPDDHQRCFAVNL
jgi:hypothetical protein